MTPPIMTSFEGEIKDLEQAQTLVSHLNEEEKRLLSNALSEGNESKKEIKKESKEIAIKSLEFEKETFRINSDGFEEVTEASAKKNLALEKFLDKGIRVKSNATGSVVEYMEDKVYGNLKCKKGEQVFINYNAFILEVCNVKNCSPEEVQKKYLMTGDEFEEKMKDKPSGSKKYKDFFNEEINGFLAGGWGTSKDGFLDVGGRSGIWLVGGGSANFKENKWTRNESSWPFGFSGRLLKN